jgi:hypothetical protein
MAKTLLQIKTEIRNDLDLWDEFFMPEAQINSHINKAQRDAHAMIINLYEDYFIDTANIALVATTYLYNLPANIFADKIRRIIYNDGSKNYRITRIENINLIPLIQSNDDYRYKIINDTTGKKLQLYPVSRETSGTNVTIYYIRKPEELTLDTDELDIPEFENYIIAKAKDYCLDKDPGNPIIPKVMSEVAKQEDLMATTLSNRHPDDQGLIQADYSDFNDSNCYDYDGGF